MLIKTKYTFQTPGEHVAALALLQQQPAARYIIDRLEITVIAHMPTVRLFNVSLVQAHITYFRGAERPVEK